MKQIIFLYIFLVVVACQSKKHLDEEAVLNKVLVQAKDFTLPQGFVFKKYYTGNVISETEDSLSTQHLIDTLKFTAAGNYFVKVLAATSNYNTDQFRQVSIKIRKLEPENEQVPIEEISLMIDQQRATKWHHLNDKSVLIADSGLYQLSLHVLPQVGSKLYLDQILFVDQADYQPKGYEYEEDVPNALLPPAWAFGVIYGSYADQENTNKIINRLLSDNYPVDAFWTDSWFWNHYNKGDGPDGYLNFVGDTTAFPNMEDMWANMERNKIKSGIWVWDAIQDNGNEEVFQEFLSKGYFREEPKENTDGWHNRIKNAKIGNIDFSNPDAVKAWKQKMTPMFKSGVDFLKLDRSSSIDYLKANYELTQEFAPTANGRGFIMSHLHTTHEPEAKYFPIKWSGDAMIAWDQPDYPNMSNYSMGGLKQNIQMVADPNKTTYENVFMSNDIGGYNFFGCEDFSDELYIRWVQFGMLAPISTVFTTADNPSGNLPFNFSELAQNNFKFYAKLKQSLFPYFYSYAHQAVKKGEKIRRGDGEHDTQYLLGEEFLVAPVYQKGAISREITFPEGEWINFYNETEIHPRGKATVKAPLNEMPLFVKKGSVVPRRKIAANLASGSNEVIEWHIYPAENGSFTLIEDDGMSTDYLKGQLAETKLEYSFTNKKQLKITINPTAGEYKNMPKQRVNQLYIHGISTPKSVVYNGKEVAYDEVIENVSPVTIIALPQSSVKDKLGIQISFN